MENGITQSGDDPIHDKNYNEYSVTFLLAEYERLRNLHSDAGQRAFRRFEFYIAIITGVLGASLLISQQQGMKLSEYIIDLVVLALFIYGVITYINLAYASSFQLQTVRAMKLIQNYFKSRDAEVRQYLYFDHTVSKIPRYHFMKVLLRGAGGGSEKTVIALVNSVSATYLVTMMFTNHLLIQRGDIVLVGLVLISLACSVIFHTYCVVYMYNSA